MKILLLYSSLLFACFFTGAAFAQEDIKSQAEAAGFLNIIPDARSAAMGGTGVSAATEAATLYHNGALAVFNTEKAGISYSYTPWMKDLISGSALHAVSAWYRIGNKQSILAGFRSFSHPESALTDENGNIFTHFTPSEWSLDLGYSRLILENFSLSLTLHYIHSDMGSYNGADAGNAIAFDLGASYRHNTSWLEGAYWTAGLQLRNIGSKIKYLNEKYNLPGKINAGGSLYLPFSENHQLTCALDLNYQFAPSHSDVFGAGLGVEYTTLRYLAVRGGYHSGNKDKGVYGYGSVGCGLHFHHIRGDFAYWITESDSPLKNTFHLSVGIDMGLFCKQK